MIVSTERSVGFIPGTSTTGTGNCQASHSVLFENLIQIPLSSDHIKHSSMTVCLFNACSVGTEEKRTAINDFVLEHEVTIFCVTESWLRSQGDEAK